MNGTEEGRDEKVSSRKSGQTESGEVEVEAEAKAIDATSNGTSWKQCYRRNRLIFIIRFVAGVRRGLEIQVVRHPPTRTDTSSQKKTKGKSLRRISSILVN